ncbi:MAG: TIGR03016 family PEP-CTERM system-associated outer membrane protein [Chromatiales bacterium]|nr:TIGR03016 family PEP-CTERM system-associated outer membrane protein [Chromatiales bacterium]
MWSKPSNTLHGIHLLAAGITFVAAHSAAAGDWTIVPRFNVEETFTDNVSLAAPGNERHEFITSVEPGLSISGTGKRLQLTFDYNVEGLIYQRDATPNAINQQMQTNATAELWEDVVFIDVDATRSQQNGNSLVATASDNLSSTGNSIEVTTFNISPYVRHRLGSFADSEFRYTVDAVSNDANGLRTTSSSSTSESSLRSGKYFSRVQWSLSYRRQRVITTSGSINRFRNIEGEVRYQFNRSYGVVAKLGKQRNVFPSTQTPPGGRHWEMGLIWTPSARTSLDARFGRQPFGRNHSMEFSHRSKRLKWDASFSQQQTSSRQLQLERVLIPLTDVLGNPVVDPTSGAQVEIPVDTINPTDEVVVQARFDGSAVYSGRRTTARLAIFSEERTFQVSGNFSQTIGASFNVDRKITPQDTLTASGSMSVSKDTAANQKDERTTLSLRYTHLFGKNLRGVLGYNKVKQNSSSAGNEYDENRVSVGLLATF